MRLQTLASGSRQAPGEVPTGTPKGCLKHGQKEVTDRRRNGAIPLLAGASQL